MSKRKPYEYLDEILKETENYRCQYIDILIEKYVKPNDEVVEICLHNFTVAESTNYLKRIEQKPFGYLSSYECKTAKKTVNSWKKSVILQRRAAFRKYVGLSSNGEKHYTNFRRKQKHLSPGKINKTSSLIETVTSSDEESETILSNETELFDDEHSITLAEEGESSLSCEEKPSLISNTTKNLPERRQNNSLKQNKTVKFSTTENARPSFSVNNVQESSNFEIKNCNVNVSKFNNHKKLDILIENFSSTGSGRSNDKEYVYEKLSMLFKGVSEKGSQKERHSNYSFTSKSFMEHMTAPKFRLNDIGMGLSHKLCHTPNTSNLKSLLCASSKSPDLPKSRFAIYDMEITNKKYLTSSKTDTKSISISDESFKCPQPKQISNKTGTKILSEVCEITNYCNDKSLSSASNSFTELPKLRLRGKDGKVISNKNYLTSNMHSPKSASVIDKFKEHSKCRFSGIGLNTPNVSSQAVSNSKFLKDTSLSHSLGSNLENSIPKSVSVKNKSIDHSKNKSSEVGLKTPNKNYQTVSNSLPFKGISLLQSPGSNPGNSMSKSFSISDKSIKHFKNKMSEIGLKASNKNCETISNSLPLKSTSLLYPSGSSLGNSVPKSVYVLNKSIEHSKYRSSGIGLITSNKNCETVSNSLPFKSTSLLHFPRSKMENSLNIDPLSLKSNTDSKKSQKKKSSLVQSTLPFQKSKFYAEYLRKSIKIDDLSLNKSPQTSKNQQKQT